MFWKFLQQIATKRQNFVTFDNIAGPSFVWFWGTRIIYFKNCLVTLFREELEAT
jgi:hypothetical protein